MGAERLPARAISDREAEVGSVMAVTINCQEYERFEPINRMFELVARTVSPTVVHIVAEDRPARGASGCAGSRDRVGRHRSRRRTRSVRADNHHVVRAKPKIRIFSMTPHPGSRADLERRQADIAVLKLDRDDLRPPGWATATPPSWEPWVLAQGSPFGLMHSVARESSARGRHMDQATGCREPGFPSDRCGDQPEQLGRPVGEHEGRGDRHQQLDRLNGGGNEASGSASRSAWRWIMNGSSATDM
jgi:S1-C subfamily serine protease